MTTATCRQNNTENVEIVALVKQANAEIIKTIKQAWRFNRDKRRFEPLSIKGITCVNEALE